MHMALGERFRSKPLPAYQGRKTGDTHQSISRFVNRERIERRTNRERPGHRDNSNSVGIVDTHHLAGSITPEATPLLM